MIIAFSIVDEAQFIVILSFGEESRKESLSFNQAHVHRTKHDSSQRADQVIGRGHKLIVRALNFGSSAMHEIEGDKRDY